MKEFLGLKKITVKNLCTLAMLTSLTVLLAIFCTFRIGDTIKIPLKFITVFITAFSFGPVWAGVVGALGDILNSILVPVGPLLPQITIIEFLYGFIWGLFFYRNSDKYYTVKTIICSVILTLIDLFAVSYILMSVGYFPSFTVAFTIRLPASVIKSVLYIVTILVFKKFQRFIGRRITK